MTQEKIAYVKSQLKLYILKYGDMKNDTEIATIFLDKENTLEDKDIELSHRSIRRYVSQVRKADLDLEEDINEDEEAATTVINDLDMQDTQIDKSPEEDPRPYNEIIEASTSTEDAVSTDEVEPDFILKYSGQEYSFDRRTVDKVICAYSRKGMNLTTGTISNVLGLSMDELKAIITRLSITKESDPYSQKSLDELDDSILFQEMGEHVSEILDGLNEHDTTTTGKLNKLYKKSIITTQHEDLKFKALVEDIKDLLPKVKITPYIAKEDTDNDFPHLHVIIPDMHIGMEQANYNLEIIRDQLAFISDFIYGYENIHVHFLGDILHSVSGLNHKDAWKNMDPTMHGANAIIEPYKLLLEFLASIDGLYNVNVVGGNHDRLQASWSDEHTGEGAKLLAFMLDTSLEGIDVTFNSARIVDDSDPNLTMILLHGDKKVDNLPAKDIVWDHGNKDKFNYVAIAHLHCREIKPKDDSVSFRKERLAAFCPQDDYGKSVAKASMPGIKLVAANEDRVPFTIDVPLTYANL